MSKPTHVNLTRTIGDVDDLVTVTIDTFVNGLRGLAEATGDELDDVNFTAVRGMSGTREASVQLNGRTVRVAVASGLGNARKILENIEKGTSQYDVIEIMACPGGCVNGGGQPYTQDRQEVVEQRIKGLYAIDDRQTVRKSHKNPSVQRLYQEFFGEPGSDKAHELLHASH